MKLCCRIRTMEAVRPIPHFPSTISFGNMDWYDNIRDREVITHCIGNEGDISLLGLNETRWTQSGQKKMFLGVILIYSEHEDENSPIHWGSSETVWPPWKLDFAWGQHINLPYSQGNPISHYPIPSGNNFLVNTEVLTSHFLFRQWITRKYWSFPLHLPYSSN